MQPLRRYNLDAAILFSDILVVLQALGFEVAMPGGLGITVPEPILSVEDMKKRMPLGLVDVRNKLAHVIRSVELIKQQLGDTVPLIGFSGAPWTLMYYLLGGTSKKNKSVGSDWLKQHPEEGTQLLDQLTAVVIDYLSAQVEAGVDVIQVFEAMGDYLDKEDFNAFAMPCLRRIAQEMKLRHPNIPIMVFPKGASHSLEALQTAGYDVVTLDAQVDRSTIRSRLLSEATCQSIGQPAACIQGNFDVTLLRKGTSEMAALRRSAIYEATREMLVALEPQKLIANLGEGLTGSEDPELVAAFIDAVHDVSEELIYSA